MTSTQLHSVLDLLAEARRLMGSDEIHAQFTSVPRDTVAIMLVDGARIADNGPSHVRVEMERAKDHVVIDATENR